MQISRDMQSLRNDTRVGERITALLRRLGHVPSNSTNTQSMDSLNDLDSLDLESFFRPISARLSSLLDWISKEFPNQASNDLLRDAQALLKTLIPRLTDPSLTTAELRAQIQQLLDLAKALEPSELSIRLRQTLNEIFPESKMAPPTAELSKLTQQCLNLLATNEFSHLGETLQLLNTQINAQITKTGTDSNLNQPISQNSLAPLLRLLAPIQELQSLGAPPSVDPQVLSRLRQSIEQGLAIPLQSSLKESQQIPSGTIPVQIQEIKTDSAEILLPNGKTLTLPLPTHWQGILKEQSTIAMSFFDSAHDRSLIAGSEFIGSTTLASDPLRQSIQNQAAVPSTQSNAVLPHPESIWLPPQELSYWIQSQAPLTANLVDARNILSDFGDLPASPKLARDFAQVLHQLDINLPAGQVLSDDHKELALRWLLTGNTSKMPQGLSQYQAKADPEAALFQSLSPALRQALSQELNAFGFKPFKPEQLLEIVQKTLTRHFLSDNSPASSVKNSNPAPGSAPLASSLADLHGTPSPSSLFKPGDAEVLQSLQRQLTWTQVDQDTRHPDDRQQVFYWHHQGELHKGRIQVRHEHKQKKGSGHGDSEQRFFVETKTPRLGEVRVDFRIRHGQVELLFADSKGKAQEAIIAERPLLAQELQEAGWQLGDLIYQVLKNPALANAPTQRPSGHSGTSYLDVRA